MAMGKVRQRTVYWVTAGLVACMISGFAMATVFSTGGSNTTYQGSQTTTVDAVTGLQYSSTNLMELASATGPAGCSSGSPCNVATAGVTVCTGGFTGSTSCAAQDFVQQVNLTTIASTQFPGTVQLTLFVTGTPAGGSGTTTVATSSFYFTESAAPSSPTTITLDFDVGTSTTGPGTVTSVTVTANA
jgi:hypothetical protein